MEHRDDLSKLLLDGLPADEREHVINVIQQGDAEKLRRKRAERPIPTQDGDDQIDREFGEEFDRADAADSMDAVDADKESESVSD